MSIKARAELELNSIDDKASQVDLEEVDSKVEVANINISNLDLFILGGRSAEVTTSPYEEDELSVVSDTFYEAVGEEYGTYEFEYDGTDWTLNGNPVQLDAYGITLTATPEQGDTFSVEVKEVVGSMQELNDQHQELENTVNENKDTAEADLIAAQAALQAAIYEVSLALHNAQTLLETVDNKTAGMGFTTENGLLLYGIGSTDRTGFKLQLSSQAINFINGELGKAEAILANVSGNILNISNANILKRLNLGNYSFIPRSNDHMALKYMG